MSKIINKKNVRRSYSAGGRSIKGWVGKNMSGQRLRLGEKTYNKSTNPNKKNNSENKVKPSNKDFENLRQL
jgi:hypothetical protein